METEISCGAVLYRKNKGKLEYLIIKDRNDNYTFPKGHINPGETFRECAMREVEEEVGLNVVCDNDNELLIEYELPNGNWKDVYFYIANFFNNKPCIKDGEVKEIKILSYKKAMDLLSFSNLKNLLKYVNNELTKERKIEDVQVEIFEDGKKRVITSFLSKPEAGWSDFTLGKECYHLSYVKSVAINWLEKIASSLEYGSDFVVDGNCESDGEMYCHVTNFESYTYYAFSKKHEVIQIGSKDFIKILIHDIETNIDEWAEFESWHDSWKEKMMTKRYIRVLIDKINSLQKRNTEQDIINYNNYLINQIKYDKKHGTDTSESEMFPPLLIE